VPEGSCPLWVPDLYRDTHQVAPVDVVERLAKVVKAGAQHPSPRWGPTVEQAIASSAADSPRK
jgi:hypothetical protein